jgi:enamine deaminase RidA (YjgF/YER057c/UK114 family)
VLAGPAVETLFSGARPAGRVGNFALFEVNGWLLGQAQVPLFPDLESVTRALYAELLKATKGRHLARIWNYVPAINEPGPDGLENYRAFCRGRSLAFEAQHGREFHTFLPAASAVGCYSSGLSVVFAASDAPPRHVENPWQVPAYDYPSDYGPRAPSFARATIVPAPTPDTVFISGTAAIRGHVTVAPSQTRDQLTCTLDNLDEIARHCGLSDGLRRTPGFSRHFKIYLRHATDLRAVASFLEAHLIHDGDTAAYVQADICRAQLNVEIEATLFRSTVS